GTFLGILLALFGTFLVLRRMAFLGITLSQIVTFGVALSLFLGWGGEWFAVIFSGLVFLPLVYFQSKEWKHFDSFLGILLR
ncbi:MAG: metal ABC transporter permease, partial [Candidatus Jordarchaeaceae archaeon]